MQNKQGGGEEGCACPPQDFLLVSERHGQTRGLTSVRVFLQELWGTGNPNPTVETEQRGGVGYTAATEQSQPWCPATYLGQAFPPGHPQH